MGTYLFSTRIEIVLDEPTFINQPMPFKITALADRHKKDKHEFTFITRLGDWVYIISDYVIVDSQFPILAQYHDKHAGKLYKKTHKKHWKWTHHDERRVWVEYQ